MPKRSITPSQMAQFKFGLIAPVIQNLYPDVSAAAYYRRITENPIIRPDGTSYQYKPDTLERWTSLYKKEGLDALLPQERSDKGNSRKLNDTAIEQIFNLRIKFPKAPATMIRSLLLADGFITEDVSERAIQRFIRAKDLKSARDPNVKDRKAFETEAFGCLWQADTAYLPYITEDGKARRTYVIMIIDDHSRMIVGGQIFYNDNGYNFQTVLKNAISAYGIPDKLLMDNGSSYSNEQLSYILASAGIVEIHAKVRDGAGKGKVERNFRTLRNRLINVLDPKEIHSLAEFNAVLADYIRKHNTTVHSAIHEMPIDRYLRTKEHARAPKSQEWLNECFMNRVTRKVNNDSCVTIDGVLYDAPQQFIRMKVDIRYLPNRMEDAYILYEGKKYPIPATDKVANSKAKRNNPTPAFSYYRNQKGAPEHD